MSVVLPEDDDLSVTLTTEYTPLTQDVDTEDDETVVDGRRDLRPLVGSAEKPNVSLSPQDKWRLVKPLLLKYMVPLCESIHVISRVWQIELAS